MSLNRLNFSQTIRNFSFRDIFCIGILLFVFFSPFFCFLCALEDPSSKSLKINLIIHRNGIGLETEHIGLETDQKVLAEALEKLGYSVRKLNITDTERSRADINIFFEFLEPNQFAWAKFNWFVPNPEWYRHDINLLDKIDLILCRTREVERIFQELNKVTYYLGFTSIDCYQEEIKKDYSHLFHLAGASLQKGTSIIQNVWLSYSNLPLLTVIKYPDNFISKQTNLEWIPYRIPLDQLRLLQNQCGIHLCPSETEGFGHYIIEAMSAGAVVITTNAPPMNEFIQDPRCLIPYVASQPCRLGICYHVDPIELDNKIKYLISLPPAELAAIGLNNRNIYLQKKEEFYQNLRELIKVISCYNEL